MRRVIIGFAIVAAVPTVALAQGAAFPPAEQTAILKAAGATALGADWTLCRDAPDPTPAVVDALGDLNGDGQPEALVTQEGTFCYGASGMGFQVLTRGNDGQWIRVPEAGGAGFPTFLKTKGAGGWPDLEIGGPGFCFPVWRFDGKAYAMNRKEYEGKPCK